MSWSELGSTATTRQALSHVYAYTHTHAPFHPKVRIFHEYDRQNERMIARQPILVPVLQGGPPMFEPRHGPQHTFPDLIRFNPDIVL